jgi:hypothetical protein
VSFLTYLFLTGTSASDVHFQAFLLEGIARWNENRMRAAVLSKSSIERCHDDQLKAAHSQLATQLFGQPTVEHHPPMKYTGELFGIEYLNSQTGQSLKLVKSDSDDEEEDEIDEELEELDEGIADIEDLTVSVDVYEDITETFNEQTAETAGPSAATQSSSDTETVSITVL